MDSEVFGDLFDRHSGFTVPSDTNDVVAELVRVGLGHDGILPDLPHSWGQARSDVTYSCSRPGGGGPGDGRNADVFTLAKGLACQGVPLGEAEAQLQERNNALPEPLSEVEVARAVRSAFKSRRGSNPYLQRLARKGGSRNTEAQQTARSRNLQKADTVRHERAGQRFDFVLEHWTLSDAELALELEVDPRTIRRYRQDAKRTGLVPV
ncbi:primase C-terminal domain-containing protein [Tessaracoccus sp. Y36]